MKKKWLWIACVVLAAATVWAAQAEVKPGTHVVVGHTTRMSGNFLSELWGNNTADIDVRSLLHEYPTIAWTSSGDYVWNSTVVNRIKLRQSQNSSTTYITVHDDLYYSDGTQITAKDYVFSLLLSSSPAVKELGGMTAQRDYIKGHAQYASGKSRVLEGVGLVDEYTFFIRIDAKHLPLYNELAYMNVQPYPLAVIAPGCDVRDDGKGAYISGEFTAELLRETLLDPQTGYVSHPSVTSGPYTLTGYSPETHEATFEANPFYKGNYRKQKPSIERLTFKEVRNEDVLDEFLAGRVDVINKVSSGEVIDGAAALVAEGLAEIKAYPRTGLSFLAFVCEEGDTQSVLLRQAVARLIDKEAISDRFLMGYGEPVYGYYGLGQWMAREKEDELKKLNLYPLDPPAAAALLAKDGWTLNAEGGEFKPETDFQRYRLEDGLLKPLQLRLAISEDNKAGELVASMLGENFAGVGGELEVSRIGMEELLRRYYRQEERGFDLFFLGTNFTYVFDPYYSYQTGDEYQGAMNMNTSGLLDERLLALANRLRQTEPGNRYIYLARWMAFQRYWAEVLPMVPLYSNIYSDIYAPWITNYRPERYWNWGTAILYADSDRVYVE